jgi:hypothetical protein
MLWASEPAQRIFIPVLGGPGKRAVQQPLKGRSERYPDGRPQLFGDLHAQYRVERKRTRTGQHERQPAHNENDIGAHEVGVGAPAGGEKEDKVEEEANQSGKPCEESEQYQQADRELCDDGEDADHRGISHGMQEKTLDR